MKFSEPQARALSILPCPVPQWEAEVKPVTRRNLESRGFAVRTVRRYRHPYNGEWLERPIVRKKWTQLPPSYIAIRAKCQELGLPKHHKGWDLHHCDRGALIANDPLACFFWCVRSYGTHIINPTGDWGNEDPTDYLACLAGHHKEDPECQCFWWNGRMLQSTTWDRAKYLLQEARQKWVDEFGNVLGLDDDEILRYACKSFVIPEDAKIKRISTSTVEITSRFGPRVWVSRKNGKVVVG